MSKIDDMLNAVGTPAPSPPPDEPSSDDKIGAMLQSLQGAGLPGAKAVDTSSSSLGATALASAQNTVTGAAKAVDDAFWGPIVMVMNRFSPTAAKSLYDKVNQDTPITHENPSAPLAYGIGKMLGLTGAYALAGPEAGVAKTAAVGAALGGTQLQDPANEGNRVADAIWGAAGAAGGKMVGDLTASGFAKVVNSIGAGRVVSLAQDAVQGMEKSGIKLRDKINATYAGLKDNASSLYNLRNIAGKEIGTVPADALSADLKEFGSSDLTARTKSALKDVTKTLTGPDGALPTLHGVSPKLDDPTYQEMLKQFMDSGNFNLPTKDITPQSVFDAYSKVNKLYQSTRDPATRAQLNKLRGILDDQVTRISGLAGKSTNTLRQQFDAANNYFKENVVPFRDYFGLPKGYDSRITGGMTAKEVDDQVLKTLESNDPEKIAGAMKVIKGNEDHVAKLVMQRALNTSVGTKGIDYGKVSKYFTDHSQMVNAMPKQYQDMMKGFTNFMQPHPFKHVGGHSHPIIGGFATVLGLERIASGEITQGLHIMGGSIVALGALRAFNKLIDVPAGRRFLTAASKLGPNSPAWARLTARIMPLISASSGEQAATKNSTAVDSYLPRELSFGQPTTSP